ncbi:MAG: LOG family protein [Gammaproteobacteria bacterium]
MSGNRPPAPPARLRRREPLPWQTPKPAEDDRDAPARLKAILESPSYCEADQDVDFLQLPETRGLRLQVDYAKPEMLLARHGIEQTVVVFGSTRIPEPAAARRALEARRAESAAHPGDQERQQRVHIAERIVAKSRYYDIAREFAQLVARAEAGVQGSRLVVLTGGGPGIMEAANRGAFDVGAKSVGLNIKLPHEQFPNPYITPELCMRFHYFALRKLHFLLRARALVAFPGGYGTLDELFETLTLVQTRKIKPVPVVLVGREFWQKAFDPDFLVAEGVVDPEDRELFWYAESAGEIWDGIRQWYAANGEPLA